MKFLVDKYFLMSARGATLKNEIYADIVTFLAMSYILAVKPAILGVTVLIIMIVLSRLV